VVISLNLLWFFPDQSHSLLSVRADPIPSLPWSSFRFISSPRNVMSSAITLPIPRTLRGEPLRPCPASGADATPGEQDLTSNYGGPGATAFAVLARYRELAAVSRSWGAFTGSHLAVAGGSDPGLRADSGGQSAACRPSAGAYRKFVQWLRACRLGFALPGRRMNC